MYQNVSTNCELSAELYEAKNLVFNLLKRIFTLQAIFLSKKKQKSSQRARSDVTKI